MLQKNRNTPVCTIEHSKTPQDEREKKPKKIKKTEIMKGIIHKEKGNATHVMRNSAEVRNFFLVVGQRSYIGGTTSTLF